MSEPEHTLSVKGCSCPVPLIRLSQTIATMAPGELLSILGDDPVFEVAVRDYCLVNEHEVLSVSRTADDEVCIRIRV